MPSYRYPRPAVTVDAVVFGAADELSVLLIKRKGAPFRGRWALPGGFVQMREDLEAACRRELKEETGVEPAYLEQLYTFGAPKRDPRGRVISVAYLALVNPASHEAVASSDASAAQWVPFWKVLSWIAFDHRNILDVALARLRAKVRYAPIGFDLLPGRFSLVELQALYEKILGTPLDKRNFRKKILSTNLLDLTGEVLKHGRPTRMYRFNRNAYEDALRTGFSFDL